MKRIYGLPKFKLKQIVPTGMLTYMMSVSSSSIKCDLSLDLYEPGNCMWLMITSISIMFNPVSEIVNMEPERKKSDKSMTIDMFTMKVNVPVTLKFEDVTHKIKVVSKSFFGRRGSCEEKEILKGISGGALPGELLALLGPSGSGKTTLLTALGDRLKGLSSGRISYNGKPLSQSMKRKMGFVAQNDVLYPHLSVHETLVFVALLRLPNSLTKQEKVLHTQAVIEQLHLTDCKNNIIGGPGLRGISGGERRRVSIGQELLINPSLLLLDEPTSGLDSTTTYQIVSSLRDLAKGGRTIVTTIHQPSSKVFYMFHKVMLLSDGSTLYFGKGESAMDYFSSIGYVSTVAMNPSDFLLDLANGISCANRDEDHVEATKEALVSAYKSNISSGVMTELHDHPRNQSNLNNPQDEKSVPWCTNWWQQFSVLLKRGVKESKHESFSVFRLFKIIATAIFSGLLWWQSKSNIGDQVALLMFYSQFLAFFPLVQAIFTFPREREIVTKERASGMYRLSSYFMARTAGELPMELALPLLFVIITYWMAGLKPTALNFFLTLAYVVLQVLVSSGLGLAIGAIISEQKAASTVGNVVMSLFVLVNGFYVQNMASFVSWVKYISLSYYSFKLLLGSQFEAEETYPCTNSNTTCLVGNLSIIKHAGLGNKALSIVALLVMLVGYRVVAYLALVKIGTTYN